MQCTPGLPRRNHQSYQQTRPSCHHVQGRGKGPESRGKQQPRAIVVGGGEGGSRRRSSHRGHHYRIIMITMKAPTGGGTQGRSSGKPTTKPVCIWVATAHRPACKRERRPGKSNQVAGKRGGKRPQRGAGRHARDGARTRGSTQAMWALGAGAASDTTQRERGERGSVQEGVGRGGCGRAHAAPRKTKAAPRALVHTRVTRRTHARTHTRPGVAHESGGGGKTQMLWSRVISPLRGRCRNPKRRGRNHQSRAALLPLGRGGPRRGHWHAWGWRHLCPSSAALCAGRQRLGGLPRAAPHDPTPAPRPPPPGSHTIPRNDDPARLTHSHAGPSRLALKMPHTHTFTHTHTHRATHSLRYSYPSEWLAKARGSQGGPPPPPPPPPPARAPVRARSAQQDKGDGARQTGGAGAQARATTFLSPLSWTCEGAGGRQLRNAAQRPPPCPASPPPAPRPVPPRRAAPRRHAPDPRRLAWGEGEKKRRRAVRCGAGVTPGGPGAKTPESNPGGNRESGCA